MEEGKEQYRVVLKSIGGNTKEEVEEFCEKISKNLNLPSSLIRKIAHRNPIVLKKNLTLKKAEALAIAFKSFGANVVIEKRSHLPMIQVERQGLPPPQLALETCSLRKTPGKNWLLVGRVKNISQEPLRDVWVIIQLFDVFELINYEEVPLPINPILTNQFSPFKAILEGDLDVQKISLLFKNVNGASYFVLDQRKRRDWVEVDIPEGALKMKPLREEEISEKGLSIREEEIIQEEKEVDSERIEPAEEEKKESGEKEFEEKESESLVLDSSNSTEEIEPIDSGSEERLELIEEEEKEDSVPYPWIGEFKAAIETYDQYQKDGLSLWIKNLQEENLIESPYHLLLVLLTYSRFNQKSDDESALQNTQRVFPLLLRSNISLNEVPELEGTPYFSPEVWRNLFYRALPKIQEVARAILDQRDWKAGDLERFFQIIPQMGLPNSRWMVRVIQKWIPEKIQIDFSDSSVIIGEGLYRVASRLGIVNPFFDFYQGRNSLGDLKIQSFAKTVFPENPMRIEEPMEQLGKEGREGHCFPVEPNCLGCMFESFCPKFYTEINPSEKGMVR